MVVVRMMPVMEAVIHLYKIQHDAAYQGEAARPFACTGEIHDFGVVGNLLQGKLPVSSSNSLLVCNMFPSQCKLLCKAKLHFGCDLAQSISSTEYLHLWRPRASPMEISEIEPAVAQI